MGVQLIDQSNILVINFFYAKENKFIVLFNFSAIDDFNNGVVLTSRPLRPNELFEVRLDKIVTKWAGSIEIGVTTHSPTELEFPFTMTNVRYYTIILL